MNNASLTRPQRRRLALMATSSGALALLLGTWIQHQIPDEFWTVFAWSNWLESTGPVAFITLLLAAVSFVAIVYLAMVTALCFAISLWRRPSRLNRSMPTRDNPRITYREPELASRSLLPRWLRIAAPTWLIVAILSLATPSVGATTTSDESAGSTRSTLSEAPVMVMIEDVETTRDRPRTYLPRSEPVGAHDDSLDPMSEAVDAEAEVHITPAVETSTAHADSAQIYVVQPGDHLWSIADHRVSEELKSAADNNEVREYWLRLIEINRDNLVDPHNADLIFPGQELVLPPRA